MDGTADAAYTDRLRIKSGAWWKRALDVQRPYRWNLRRHDLGRTIDVGCGIGRNLHALPSGSIGVDHNPESVAIARAAGLSAVTVDEWRSMSPTSHEASSYDGLLFAHVLEHMSRAEARELILEYLGHLRRGGKALFICPQERGFRSDSTHVEFLDGDALTALAEDCGLVPERARSFPFPRWLGGIFTYNEFVLLAHKPA